MATRARLNVEEYKVLFERDDFPASGTSCLYHDGVLSLTVQKASDTACGLSSSLTQSADLGKSWSEPVPFGPPMPDPDAAFQAVGLGYAAAEGCQISVGFYVPSGTRTGHWLEDTAWRPCELLVGRKPADAADFSWRRYPSGTFLGEQFAAPGILTRSGRVVITLWGAKHKGENWRCGVLLSDDGAQSLRWRQVAYEPDLSTRRDPSVPVGYNEQTLFETSDEALVSIIRGGGAIGAMPGPSPGSSEVLFSRSESTDGGETWSAPELTNLPGTGAPADGLTLPDGSLLLPARVPALWTRHEDHPLRGLHMARSFDEGRSWETELVFCRDPDGVPYDNYYNACNGTFVKLAESRAMYVFGHHDDQQRRYRANAVVLTWS